MAFAVQANTSEREGYMLFKLNQTGYSENLQHETMAAQRNSFEN